MAENQMMKNITMSVSPGDAESSANRWEECGEERLFRYKQWEGEYLIYRCPCELEREKERIQKAREEKRKENIKKLFGQSKLGKRFLQCSLENFTVVEGAEKAFRAIKELVDSFPPPRGEGLVLYGPPGGGKTHLSAACALELLEREYAVIFEQSAELMYRFNRTYTGGGESEEEIMQALIGADLLILDDLEKGKWTDKVEERIYVIVNGRYRDMKPLLITTNLNPPELEHLVGRAIFDRLREMVTFVPVVTASFRKKEV